jgi:MinD superfamily P-loop ATPase
MRIAVASGKGGTGKTSVATSLALIAAQGREKVVYADCDVEEPNGAIFLKPIIDEDLPVNTEVPVIDQALCTNCGVCAQICQYKALACTGQKVLVFPEMCHACGGCWLACPAKAIRPQPRTIGRLQSGQAGNVLFVQGVINVGEMMSPTMIKQVKASLPSEGLIILDCPPGTSCPVVEAMRGCDYVLLVTEPTPFGLNDLELAAAVARRLDLPCGVVINRADCGDGRTRQFCEQRGIPVVGMVPDDRAIAEAYSRGTTMVEAVPALRPTFAALLEKVTRGRGAR